MLEKVLKLVIYYIDSVKFEKDKNLKECLVFIQLLNNIANDDLKKVDYIIQDIPETHPIKVIWEDIKKSPVDDYKKALIESKQLVENYSKDNSEVDIFSKLQEHEDIDKLVTDIINCN